MIRSTQRHVPRALAAWAFGILLLAAAAPAEPRSSNRSNPGPISHSPQTDAQTPPVGASSGSSTSPSSGSGESQGNISPALSPADEHLPGAITGTVMDGSDLVVSGVTVKLTRGDGSTPLVVVTGQNGDFTFSNVAPGPFEITATFTGFASRTESGDLQPGDTYIVPPMSLDLATVVTQVEVIPQDQVAEAQVKQEEKQRIVGMPVFYVTYLPDPAPLNTRQKFELAWKTSIDPVTLAFTAGQAGLQQWQGQFKSYGKGAQAYPKYYGAAYGDVLGGTFLGGAILPSLLKQDPRYFYKGTGTVRFRLLYALANAFVCKGDNKRWQPNYSNMLGNLAAGGLSNLYSPAQNHNEVALTFENALLGIGTAAASNIFEEFFSRKPTSRLPSDDSEKHSWKTGMVSNALTYLGQ